MAETSCRRSPSTATGGSGSTRAMVMPRWSAVARTRSTASAITRLTSTGLAGRRLLGLDPAQVEQVVDDPADPEGLGVDAAGQPLGHLDVGLGDEGLGQQAERAHGGLQLVAHVGHEVAADLLEPAALGDVLDHGDHPEGPPPVVDEPGPHRQGAAGRAVEVEGALGCPLVPGVLEQLGDRLGGQGVAVAAGHEGVGPGVAVDDGAVLVAQDDTLGEACRATAAAGWRRRWTRPRPRWPPRSPARGRPGPSRSPLSSGGGSMPRRVPRAMSRWLSARRPARRPRRAATAATTTNAAPAMAYWAAGGRPVVETSTVASAAPITRPA